MVGQHVRGALLLGAALLCRDAALAQDETNTADLSALLACAEIDREILRLECYDDAVAALRADRAPRGEDAAGASRAADAAAARAEAARGPAPADAGADAAAARPPRVVAERELDAAPDARGDAREDDDRDRSVRIVEVRTQIPGRAVFVTSDGEEFVQTSGQMRLYLPDVPFQAKLRSGAVGGLFLTPEGTRRSIRISERD
ncbi:MAG TPA: hypothetical protein VF339_02430 [Gammaproteobacteria bacterium]